MNLPFSELEFCKSKNSNVYMQYTCEFEDDNVSHQKEALCIALTTIIISLVFRFFLHLLQKEVQLDSAKYDFKFLTTADYAIQITITESLWKQWMQHKKREKLKSFKKFLKNEIETQVGDLPKCFGYYQDSHISVADINIAYDNNDLIQVLQKRAEALKSGKNVDKIEKQIGELVEQNYDRF